ncbi:ABC transporter substrate-binding protein [Paenibacillus sp. CAU 1782]
MNKGLKKVVPAVLLTSVLAGCSFGSGGAEDPNKETVLKVMYYDERAFNQTYGMLYSALNPNVTIEVVSTQDLYRGSNNTEEGEEFDYDKAFAKLIEDEKPDVLILESEQYEKMSQDAKLLDLDTMITKDKYDTEGLLTGMVDYMKEFGGGQLYGIPTSFSSQVMYYNKALFDKYNIAYPTDQMTWDEVINLAKQFPIDGEPEDRVYGLRAGYSGDLSEISQLLASSEGITYIIPKSKQLTINTDGWKRILETSLDAINSKALYFEDRNNWGMSGGMSMDDYYMQNPFLAGRLAMTVDHNYLMQQIKEAQQYSQNKDQIVSDWDVVTVPVSAQNPDQSPNMYYGGIMAISKDATSPEEAWKFISYVTGDEYARVNAKNSYSYNFPVRTKYIKDEEGRNFEAFYKLKPTKQIINYRDYELLPTQFNAMFNDLMSTEFKALQEGTKSVTEVLELLQVKGEELLAEDSWTDEELQEYYEKQYESQRQQMMEAAGESTGSDSSEAVSVE